MYRFFSFSKTPTLGFNGIMRFWICVPERCLRRLPVSFFKNYRQTEKTVYDNRYRVRVSSRFNSKPKFPLLAEEWERGKVDRKLSRNNFFDFFFSKFFFRNFFSIFFLGLYNFLAAQNRPPYSVSQNTRLFGPRNLYRPIGFRN